MNSVDHNEFRNSLNPCELFNNFITNLRICNLIIGDKEPLNKQEVENKSRSFQRLHGGLKKIGEDTQLIIRKKSLGVLCIVGSFRSKENWQKFYLNSVIRLNEFQKIKKNDILHRAN